MKTWEALKAADEGKKIRRKWWSEGVYYVKEECLSNTCLMMCCDIKGQEKVFFDDLHQCDIFTDDWEIYEEEE